MPGISLVRDPGGLDEDAVDAALDSVLFFDDYGVEKHYESGRTVLASSGYDGYPVRAVETDEAVVVLEGHLYDVDDPEEHLAEVAALLRRERTDALRQWIRSRDGDFLVAVLWKADESVSVLTDALGRLPAYRSEAGSTQVVSRELKFVRALAEHGSRRLAVDRLGVAQTLAFGYRLGTRTLFEGVRRVPPASLVRVGDTLDARRLYRHDFGGETHADRDTARNAERLASLFGEACRRRGDLGEENLIALSGGLDSRAVAAGYATEGLPCRAATFDRSDGSAADEVRIAEAVAGRLDIPWRSYVARSSATHRSRLLELKQGMNYLRLSFLVDFLEQLDPPRGEAVYVTGDGGDKALPRLSPPREFDTLDDLVTYTISANAIFGASEAADLAGVTRASLVRSVEDRLSAYPEAALDDKYVHFLIRERGMNWLYHGEDRNRYYYWSVSPFYSLPFFRYAMNCPDEQKAGEALYHRFLRELAPDVADVEYANFGAPIGSAEYRLKRLAYDALGRYPSVREAAVDLIKRLRNDSTVEAPEAAEEIEATLHTGAGDGGDGRVLTSDAIDRVLADPGSYSEPAMYHLLTVASVFDDRPERATG